MEENKEKVAQVPFGEPKQSKPTYEELNQQVVALVNQVKQLYAKIHELNMANAFHRLNYLFKVLELGDKFSPEFVSSCVNEIESLMTLPEEEAEPEGNK